MGKGCVRFNKLEDLGFRRSRIHCCNPTFRQDLPAKCQMFRFDPDFSLRQEIKLGQASRVSDFESFLWGAIS